MLSELKILIIGCGKMGSSMLEGWIKGGADPEYIDIIDPYADKIDLEDKCKNLFEDNSQLQDEDYDICFLAIKPQSFTEVLPKYQNLTANKNCIFASIAAGQTTQNIQDLLENKASIIRIMPNLPATIKEGVSGIYCNEHTSQEQKNTIKALLECNGEVIEVTEENSIDKITAISGSGPAYIFHFIECMENIALDFGFSKEEAKLLAQQTVYGSAKLAQNSELSASQLRENVTSPKGTTEAALKILMNGSNNDGGEGLTLSDLLKEAINNAKLRSEELRS